MQRLVPFLAAWLPSSPPSPGTIFITDPKRPKGEGGSSSAFIRLGMSWRIFCNGDLWKTENPFFFLKKRWISLKSMLELCLKNWGPAEAFAFVHSYLFPLSIPMDFDCQVCKSWYQNLMERSIFMTLTAATIADTSPSLIGVSTPNTVATMIRWSCLFQNDPQSSTPKKAQVLHVLLGFVERPQNSNMALFCETKGLVAHNTKADVL